MRIVRSIAALPLQTLGSRPDVLVALFVCAVTLMLVVPMPGVVLDVLIPINIGCSLMVLLVALFARNALEVSTFPTLLLVTTLFRLGLNVSSTRGILAHADAGVVIRSFGEFVVRGDVVIGIVVFLVITVVQFIVVAKGAERVAEVSARFTLDAMPGRQMSIDAGVRSGAYTEEEAQEKRDELARASQMFGNMDGAMKFVKGDTIAGLVIMTLNIAAGMVIGVFRMNMSLAESLRTFGTLTIGDGLVAQIAALLITIAAGILVTRVEAKDKNKNLGFSMRDELFSNAKALFIAAVLMLVFGLIPGLPLFPFLLCSLAAFTVGISSSVFPAMSKMFPGNATLAKQAVFKAQLEKKVEEAKQQKTMADSLAPTVVPIGIDLDPALSIMLGFECEETDDETELMRDLIPQLRDALYLETGVRFPGVRVRPHARALPENGLMIRINDVPVLQERILPGHLLATVAPDKLVRLGVQAKPIQHPVSKARMSLILEEEKELVQASGVTVWSPSGMVALYAASVLRRRAKEFIGLQEVSDLVERLEKAFPALVKEVIPKIATVPQLVGVLRRLVDEGVSIRNLKSIVEALGEFGTREGDSVFLTEKVRAALGAQLAYSYAGIENQLTVVLLDPEIEDTIAGGVGHNAHGAILSLPPEVCREIVATVMSSLQPMVAKGKRPVVLTSAEIRRYVRKLIETDLPSVAVLSYDELPPDLTIQPMGRAALAPAA
jgi:type III secretion protein V